MYEKNSPLPTCTNRCISASKVKDVKEKLRGESDLFDLAEKYKILSNETRLKIISSLAYGELCVCEIAEILNLSIPATSQQLKLLRQQGLIEFRIDGKIIYYSLKDQQLPILIRECANRIFAPPRKDHI